MISAASIREQLVRFAARHPTDVDALEAMRSLLDRVAEPCARQTFDPGHFTASACVLSPSGEEVLLVHHAKLDRWLQPGGHIEAGDTSLLAAARREVAEECGVEPELAAGARVAPVDLDVHAIPARGAEPRHHHFDVRYAFVVEPARGIRRSAESHAVRWCRVDALGELDLDASARRMIERARQR